MSSQPVLRLVMKFLQDGAQSLAQAEGERRFRNRYSAAARRILSGFVGSTGISAGNNFGGGPAGGGLAVPVTLGVLGINLEDLRGTAQGAAQGVAGSGATAVTEAELAAAVAGATEVVAGGGGEVVVGGRVSEVGERAGSAVAVSALAEAEGGTGRVRQAVVVTFMLVAGLCIGFTLGYYLGSKTKINKNRKHGNGHGNGKGGNGSGGKNGGGNGELPEAK